MALPAITGLLAPAPSGAATDVAPEAQLEEMFIKTLLSEIRKSAPSLMGGEAMEAFGDLFDQEFARAIREGGGLGLELGDAAAVQPKAPVRRRPSSVTPVHGRISSTYGVRTDPIHGHKRMHDGLDIAAPAGTPVRSARSGTVSFAGDRGGYGNVVIVDHGGGLQTRYAHLRDIRVKEGERLRAGDSLGTVGSTGRSTGPHLHFEVRRRGKSVDPATIVDLKKVVKSPDR